jgi:hypothetical protein
VAALTPDDDDMLVIACDESGSEGENLMRSPFPIFVHASTDLTPKEAASVMRTLRAATGSRAAELKSSDALNPRHRQALISMLTPLASRANLHLVDKAFYTTAKLVDLLIAAEADLAGIDMRSSGDGRWYASILFDRAPADVGPTFWRMLLRRYNEFIRVYARKHQKPPTTEPFFKALETALGRATDAHVRTVLQLIWRARFFAVEYQGPRAGQMREMDPAFSTLAAVAKAWRIRVGDQPMAFLIDTYSTLTEDVGDDIILSAREDLQIAGRTLPGADLRSITQMPSHLDARIQVADILAGSGREAARLAFEGLYDDPLQVAVSPMLDLQGMWSVQSPLNTLYERRPPSYARKVEGRK